MLKAISLYTALLSNYQARNFEFVDKLFSFHIEDQYGIIEERVEHGHH